MSPVSPSLAENLAADVVELYAGAERVLLARIAKSLAKGIESPQWVEAKLSEVQAFLHAASVIVAQLGEDAGKQAALAITMAYNRGGATAATDVAAALGITLEEAVETIHGLDSVTALVADTRGKLAATAPRILRATEDAYRSIVAETAGQVLTGTQTRLQAAQSALDRFAKKGITGFVDKAGRGWNLESYTEMAMRTGAGRAAVQGHVDRLQHFGLDLVIVSDAPRECPLCSEWEGKVLSLSGNDPKYPSLEQARSDGLMHVNCRHSVSAYQEGVTRPMGDVADPEGYAATVKLRYLERQVRASKRMQAAAMDPAATAKAKARVRAYQAKIREHVATTPAKRQPNRERLGPL